MSGSDETKRFDLAKMSFDNVLRSLEYEDAKASRLIIAMAFIAAVSATVFVNLYDPIESTWQFGLTQMAWVASFFYLYLVLTLLGTLFIVAAFGPRLYLPHPWRSEASEQNNEPSQNVTPESRLFFKKIAETDLIKWIEHVRDTDIIELEKQYLNDLIYEAHLLSQKNSYKVQMMGIGRYLYRYSFPALTAFAAIGLTSTMYLGFGISLLCLSSISLHNIAEVLVFPKNLTGYKSITWYLQFVLLIISIGLLAFSAYLIYLNLKSQ